MDELLKLVQLVRQEAPQARVKVGSLMVTHYFTLEELLNICNKYSEYKCALSDGVGQREQLKCECKQATFTRTVDEDFNPTCGKCGRTL